jgi:hypothetical protein
LHSQNEITERLSETLSQTRDELEDAKKQNIHLKQKLDDTNKKFDESVNFCNLERFSYENHRRFS